VDFEVAAVAAHKKTARDKSHGPFILIEQIHVVESLDASKALSHPPTAMKTI
jgi:hypothetical protein